MQATPQTLAEGPATDYRQRGLWGDATIGDWFNHAVLTSSDRVAVRDLERQLTYAELGDGASRLAHWMVRAGIKPGDVVSVQLPNWVEFTIAYVACLKVGAVINPIATSLRTRDLNHIIDSCQTVLHIAPLTYRNTTYPPMLDELLNTCSTLKHVLYVSRAGDAAADLCFRKATSGQPLPKEAEHRGRGEDLAAIMFTSGSEASPKGVMLSHNNIIAAERSFAHMVNFGLEDCMFMPSPVGHATGFLHGVTLPIITATTSVLCERATGRQMIDIIEETGATGGMAVPTVAEMIIDACERDGIALPTLRFFCCGGSPVPRQLVARAKTLGVRLYSVYGSTESAPHTMTTSTDSDDRVVNTDGRACSGVEIKIVDPRTRQVLPPGAVGEEASRGPVVFMGYLNDPERTAAVLDDEGWYYSGDLAVMDEDGYIRIMGRIKDVIIRGGENIGAAEVESYLREHPHIREAAVVGKPDPVLGQRATAYLVLRDDAPHPTVEDLKTWFVAQGIAKYKIPEEVIVLEEMPRTASGKVSKGTLREWLAGEGESR